MTEETKLDDSNILSIKLALNSDRLRGSAIGQVPSPIVLAQAREKGVSMPMRAGRIEKSFGWQYTAGSVRPREGNESISTFGKLTASDK